MDGEEFFVEIKYRAYVIRVNRIKEKKFSGLSTCTRSTFASRERIRNPNNVSYYYVIDRQCVAPNYR